MTRTDTDQVHVAINGEDGNQSIVELSPGAKSVERRIEVGRPHPHAHWMSHDGKTMVTPNVFTGDSSIYGLAANRLRAVISTGSHPIATGMMPDASKYYVANFLSHDIVVIDTATGGVLSTSNLLEHYDPITGAITGPVGGLPIQTPVSPDGKYMITANTLTATITITDTATDKLVKMLPGDAGAHGVQFGRQGRGRVLRLRGQQVLEHDARRGRRPERRRDVRRRRGGRARADDRRVHDGAGRSHHRQCGNGWARRPRGASALQWLGAAVAR